MSFKPIYLLKANKVSYFCHVDNLAGNNLLCREFRLGTVTMPKPKPNTIGQKCIEGKRDPAPIRTVHLHNFWFPAVRSNPPQVEITDVLSTRTSNIECIS